MSRIYKRGKTYYVDIRENGKRVRRKVGRSKNLAELVLKDSEVKVAKHEFDFEVADCSIKDLFEAFREYSQTNHAPATCKRYQNVVQNLELFLALNYPNMTTVSQLNLTLLEKYKRFRRNTDPRTLRLPEGFPIRIPSNATKGKTRTVNYEIKTLRSIFVFGVKRGLCDRNPCQDVTLLKVTDSKQPRFLTANEIDKFLENCEKPLYPIFFTFLNTGLRLGELINLQWSDIDFTRKKLKVRRKSFWIPKAGEREIPLNEGMLDLLSSVKSKDLRESDFVFPGKAGSKLKRKLRKDLIRIAVRAGLEDLTKIHSLRHTFASHLIMKGVDLPTVQKLLGHSDIQTTMIYSHLAPDHLVDAVNKLSFDKKHKSSQPKKSLRHRTSAQELV